MSYEIYRNEISALIMDAFPHADVKTINQLLHIVDDVSSKYNIVPKTTDIIVSDKDLPQWAKEYLVAKKIQGLSEKTLFNKRIYLYNFFKAISKPIPSISPNDIRLYLFQYQKQRNVTDRSLDAYRTILSSFFSWLQDNEYINKNPTKNISPIKYEKKQRLALTQYELEIIRSKCYTKREKAIIEFFYSTGCRVAELCNVQMCDIDWKNWSVKLFGKGKKERISYLNAKAIVAIREHLSSCGYVSNYLFGSIRYPHDKVTTGAIEKTIRKIGERVSKEIDKPITPHIMRHTTATQALKSGMPIEQISRLLGHANIDTTRIYAEIAESEVQINHDKFVV